MAVRGPQVPWGIRTITALCCLVTQLLGWTDCSQCAGDRHPAVSPLIDSQAAPEPRADPVELHSTSGALTGQSRSPASQQQSWQNSLSVLSWSMRSLGAGKAVLRIMLWLGSRTAAPTRGWASRVAGGRGDLSNPVMPHGCACRHDVQPGALLPQSATQGLRQGLRPRAGLVPQEEARSLPCVGPVPAAVSWPGACCCGTRQPVQGRRMHLMRSS